MNKRILRSAMPRTGRGVNSLTREGLMAAHSFGNGMGTAIAIAGVLLYSFVKRYERQQKDKAAAAQ
jgi:hypothetical protein